MYVSDRVSDTDTWPSLELTDLQVKIELNETNNLIKDLKNHWDHNKNNDRDCIKEESVIIFDNLWDLNQHQYQTYPRK